MNKKSVEAKLLQNKLERDIDELRSKEGYLNAGKPHYTTLFGRDSIISAWQMLRLDPDIARATLLVLAKLQGQEVRPMAEEEPGKILHQLEATPSPRKGLPDWPMPYYGSVDSTPLFIFLAGEYLKATGEKGFVESLWHALKDAERWMREYGDSDKDLFLEYDRHNPDAELHQGWRDCENDCLNMTPPVAIVEAQGYQYAALNALAAIAKTLGLVFPTDVTARALALKQKFNEAFFWEEEQFYALGLDKDKQQRRAVSSNPGHLLFTGILLDERAKVVVDRLMQPDMLTPYGIRTHSMNEPDFKVEAYQLGAVWPHDNWIFYQGLKKTGFTKEAQAIKERLIAVLEKLGYIPELYGVDGSGKLVELHTKSKDGLEMSNRLQAWSSAALLDLVSE